MATIRDIFSRLSFPAMQNQAEGNVAQEIYGGLVAQARNPAFYMRYGMADTVTGRFDMLCLHVFLLSNRLSGEIDRGARDLDQQVFDRFIDDIDRALREIGIGDTTVPKRKKMMIRGFYGQVQDFAEPLASGDVAKLAPVVGKRFYGSAGTAQADLLAGYMLRARDGLRRTPVEDIEAARIVWPDPDRIV